MSKKSLALILIGGLLLALALAVFASPFASSFPDGLEKVAEDIGFLDAAHEHGAWKSSPAPDYAAPGVQDERKATALAGLAGTLAVFVAGWGLAAVVRKRNRDNSPGKNST